MTGIEHTAEPRSAELTRPLKLGRLALAAGVIATAAMVLMLSMGVGRNAFGFAPPMPPGRIELRAQNAGGSAAAAFERQIGITPDGSAVLFMTQSDDGNDVVASQDIDSDTPEIMDGVDSITVEGKVRNADVESKAARILGGKVVEMRYAAGHIVYVRPDGSLWAAPFDRKTGRMTEKPMQIGANVALTSTGIAQFAVSKNGNVAYLPEGPRSLVIVSREGILHNLTEENRLFSNPRFSPDGKHIAVDITNVDGRDVWIAPAGGGALRRATFAQDAHDAVWAPDGKTLTYTSFRLGALGIYRSSADNAKTRSDSVFTAQPLVYSGEWLKDGSGLVTTASELAKGSSLDVAFIANKGSGPIVPVLVDKFETRSPVVSADGKRLAYVSNVSGRDEIYVRPWNRAGTVVRISLRGGTEPVWSADGNTLFYRETRSQFLTGLYFSVSDRILVVARQGLFSVADMAPGFSHANFDISPDGHSFVMVRKSSSRGIEVVTNIPELVRNATKPAVVPKASPR